MSLMGPDQAGSMAGSSAKVSKIAGNHRQGRAQLMRGIGDEVLAHGLQAHLPSHIAHQQQGLAAAVGHHLQRQIQIHLHRRANHQRHREIIAVQIVHELRRADQIVDPQADVDRPAQARADAPPGD